MLYTAGKMKGPEHAPRFMDVPGSPGVSKRAGGHNEVTPATGTEERSRESRTHKYLQELSTHRKSSVLAHKFSFLMSSGQLGSSKNKTTNKMQTEIIKTATVE